MLKVKFLDIRTQGSHAILNRYTDKGKITVPVPLHKELAKGTLKSIMNQSGISLEDLMKLVY